jgi:hypothetical protein
MLPTPPTILPAQVYAGDTLIWSRSFDSYSSADGWALKYTVVSSTAVYSFTAASQSDGSFLVTVAEATTAGWAVGKYKLVEYVDNGTQKFTLTESPLTVIAKLAGASIPVDTRTHARKVLDSIEAYLEARTPTTMLIMIDGKRLEHYPLPDILAMRDRYRIEVAREEQLSSGSPAPRLLVRF